MKSLKFFKPALATTLAIVLGWLLTARPAQAGYTVTLQQVGPDVVATGSGALDLTGRTPVYQGIYNSEIDPGAGDAVRLVACPHGRGAHEPLGPDLAALRAQGLPAQEPRRPGGRLADRL